MSLIFGNQTEDDIILKQEIDDMARMHKNFKVGPPCCEARWLHGQLCAVTWTSLT